MYLSIQIVPTILSLIWLQNSMQQKCENSICNFEAVCILEDDKPTCKCVEKFFEGDFCSEVTDHCSSNPCLNEGTCQNYPGHYNCDCLTGFSGQQCHSKQDTFKGLHFHYNHIAPIGTEQTIVLMVQNMGSVATLMEFYTAEYIIDGIVFTPTSGHFKESKDLKSLGRTLGIEHSENLPYDKGFYRISKASFWRLGTHTMNLDLSDFGVSAENFFRADFDVFVYDPSGIKCYPIIHLPHCLNPRKPLHMDIQKINFIEPIVDRRCQENSWFRIKWSVKNYIDTVVLHKFLEQSGIALTIPPYTMWFNYRDDFIQSYLIQGNVIEYDSRGTHISKTTLRCYVFVDSKPTTAYILGGTYREVNVNKEVILDGSISRDYASRPNRDQKLKYSWSCTSDDNTNPYCTENIGNAPRLAIPSQALQLHQTYRFTLLVSSSINIFSTHRIFQTIKAISDDPLLIHFYCLRNCEHGKFAAGKVIHLKLKCIQCAPENIDYSVRNEYGTEIASSQHVILVEKSKQEVQLTADAYSGALKGSTSIQLVLNQPPNKGTCSISPTSGIEYQTIFKISCFGYVDEDKPIDYKFWIGNHILDHSGDDTLTTRLFTTSGRVCDMRIDICDDIGACTKVQLKVSLEPINLDGSWIEFLSQKEANLKGLIQDGDRSAAIALIETATRRMSFDESQEIAKHVVVSLRDLKPNRLLVVEQVLAIGNNLLESIEPTSESALLISELFLKATKGYLQSIKNDEVLELQLEAHEQMVGNLIGAMARTAIEIETFPVVHNAESIPPDDPFLENYADYGELDIEYVVRMSNWLYSFQRMHKCLQVMGVVSAFIQLPGEPHLITRRNGIVSRTFIVDKSEPISLSWNETDTFIDFPNEFLQDLEGAIQVTIFESNPLWWYPEQYKINTKVLSFGVYSKNLSSINPKSIRSSFSFFMSLKSTSEDIVTHGRIQSAFEMVIYERVLPANAVLLVTILPLEYDIRILLMIGEKPRSYMLGNAKVVATSKKNTTLLLVNRSSKKRKAFLAISSQFKAEFFLTMTIRMCTTWSSHSLEWTSEYCSVGNQTNTTHIQCSCWHFSMFGAKAYPTFGNIQATENFVENLDVNNEMLVIFTVLVLFMFMLLWLAWRNDVKANENIAVFGEGLDKTGNHNYLVTIYTNGHTHAGTSSNVTIQLHGSLLDSQKHTVYSRPKQSVFYRNSKTTIVICSTNNLGNLEAISLFHDGFGRYPKWNCHMVKVRDEDKMNEYIFMVNKWISYTEPIYIPLTKKEELQSRWWIFRNSLTNFFANYYAEQCFSSARLYGQLTALEKTAIFILKFCTTLIGTLVAFGPTTIFTYETERETFYSMLLDLKKLMLIACACHLVGVLLAEVVQYLILKFRTTKNNLKYNLVLR